MSEQLEQYLDAAADDLPIMPTVARDIARLTALTAITSSCLTKLGIGRSGPVAEIDPTRLPAWSYLDLGDDDLEPMLEICTEQAKNARDLVS